MDYTENASTPVRLQEVRPHTLKQHETFALFSQTGDFTPGECSAEGLFHQDTRFLASRQMWINEQQPLLLSSVINDNNILLHVDLTNPNIFDRNEVKIAKDTIHITRSLFLWDGNCYERMRIHNYDDVPHDVTIHIRFDADFSDLFEVRGARRANSGSIRKSVQQQHAALTYKGLDGQYRHTHLAYEPAPDSITERDAYFSVTLGPGEDHNIYSVIRCMVNEDAENLTVYPNVRRDYFSCLRKATRSLNSLNRHAASVHTSNNLFNEVISRAMSDVYMLTSHMDEGPYPFAGIPWFSAPFGRDGIITAMQMLWVDPKIAKGVLRYLAAHQAKEHNAFADAEPGKILHETRQGEMANLNEVPFGHYYGSVDSTPLFLLLAARYFWRTHDLGTLHELWPNIEAGLRWINEHGDCDGDGFVEYQRQLNSGLLNQCWKDSHDSIFHADGELAEGPIAVSEVQGYVYAAKKELSKVAHILGKLALAEQLEEEANTLAKNFQKAFWDEELGFYVLALDGKKKPCRVRASNAGHILFSGLATNTEAELVSMQLMRSDFFTGWGIRTIPRNEKRYNPISYHNGSVWPHDNAMIALGMARYGELDACKHLLTSFFEAALHMEHRRLPELFCGFHRRSHRDPVPYPVACSPQAWSAAVPFALLMACLGLEFDAAREEIRLNNPQLPEFLNEITLRNVTIVDTSADIHIHRYGEKVSVNVQHKSGGGKVVVAL